MPLKAGGLLQDAVKRRELPVFIERYRHIRITKNKAGRV